VAHGIIQGVYATGTASLGQRLFPRSKFAQFASASGLVAALGFMIMPPVLGKYLDLSGNIYRHTFLISGVIGLLAFGSTLIVWRSFVSHGGTAAYKPPG
jgi:hypothetical protein